MQAAAIIRQEPFNSKNRLQIKAAGLRMIDMKRYLRIKKSLKTYLLSTYCFLKRIPLIYSVIPEYKNLMHIITLTVILPIFYFLEISSSAEYAVCKVEMMRMTKTTKSSTTKNSVGCLTFKQ